MKRTEKILPPICLLVILALAVTGCGSVSHQAQFQPTYVPKADTRIEVGPVTNETGKAFDVDIPKMFTDALTERLTDDQLLWGGGSQDVGHLIITTKIIDYDKGDAFKRWLLPGWGSTVLSMHCDLKDSVSGKLAGSVDARRTVSFGGAYTIGAWRTIFASVAKDVVGELRSQMRQA
jgi:uncharacterized protein DUF4410